MPQYAVLAIVNLQVLTVATFEAADNDDALLKGPAFVPAEYKDKLLGFHVLRPTTSPAAKPESSGDENSP